MPTVSHNPVTLPDLTALRQALRMTQNTSRNLHRDVEGPILRLFLHTLIGFMEQQLNYNERHRQALDDALRGLHRRIDLRAGTGPVADRPSAPQDGTLWLSTDETPEVLYVYAGGAWHAIDTNP